MRGHRSDHHWHYTATSSVDKPLLLYNIVASLSALSLVLADAWVVPHLQQLTRTTTKPAATSLSAGTSRCTAAADDGTDATEGKRLSFSDSPVFITGWTERRRLSAVGLMQNHSEMTTDCRHWLSCSRRWRSTALMHNLNAARSVEPGSPRDQRGVALKHDMTDTDILLTTAARSSVVTDGSILSTYKTALSTVYLVYLQRQLFHIAAVQKVQCHTGLTYQFYPKVTTLRSSLCYRKSACQSVVCQ